MIVLLVYPQLRDVLLYTIYLAGSERPFFGAFSAFTLIA
jgi:hypothetical protein